MTTTLQETSAGPAWEAAGRRAASSLDAASAAVIVGDDPVAAAHVALGIARVHAERRRVALADLVGEVPVLQDLVTTDDPHGIVDSFEYGVSLNRIARQVDAAGHLFVLPSGSEPVITEEMLQSERWRLLAESFERAGALLLLVAPAAAPGVDTLARMVDGAVLVGDVAPATVGGVRVLNTIAPPRDEAARTAPPQRAPRIAPAPARRRPIVPIVGALAAAGVAGWFFLGRGEQPAGNVDRAADSTAVPAGATAGRPADSASAAATAAQVAAAVDGAATGLLIVNPGDSARAARYSVLVSTFPTAPAARQRVTQDVASVPAATVAAIAVPAGGERHQYVAGAYPERSQADSLLRALRRRAAVGARGGSVIDRPLAFLLREGVAADSVRPLRDGYRRQGISAYALAQENGTVRLYTGAFDSAEQAQPLERVLRALRLTPTLAYRTGRPL